MDEEAGGGVAGGDWGGQLSSSGVGKGGRSHRYRDLPSLFRYLKQGTVWVGCQRGFTLIAQVFRKQEQSR